MLHCSLKAQTVSSETVEHPHLGWVGNELPVSFIHSLSLLSSSLPFLKSLFFQTFLLSGLSHLFFCSLPQPQHFSLSLYHAPSSSLFLFFPVVSIIFSNFFSLLPGCWHSCRPLWHSGIHQQHSSSRRGCSAPSLLWTSSLAERPWHDLCRKCWKVWVRVWCSGL